MEDQASTKPRRFGRRSRPLTFDQLIKNRRSWVRVSVTHGAAWFLFGGGAVLIAYLLLWGEGEAADDQAVDLFLTILPVAASIVSFWFAGRMQRGDKDDQE